MYSQGSSGAGVADLQRRLEAAGYSPGPIDGKYGPQTASAVKRYQQDHGLQVDGIAGPQTMGALNNNVAPQGAPVPPQAQAGGQPNQAAAPLNPEEDPQFLAFQRAMGVQESDLRASIAMQRSRIQRDLANEMPVFAERERAQLQSIGDNYLDRNIFFGGRRIEDQTRASAEVNRQRGMAQTQAADQQADLDMALSRQIAENRRREAEEQMASRQRLALYAAQTAGVQ